MNTQRTLTKVSAIVLYIFAGLYAVTTAWCYSLSDNIYWLFMILGLASLCLGILVSNIRDKFAVGELSPKDKKAFLVYLVISIIAVPSFILNLIAYLAKRNENEEPICITEYVAPAPKPLSRKKYLKLLVVALCIVFVSSFVAMLFTTSGFQVKVSTFRLTKEMTEDYNSDPLFGKTHVIDDDMLSYEVDLYVPNNASIDNPAPVVFIMPGFTRTKETQAQYCIELSRRGIVVFCIDPGSQGGTTGSGYVTDGNGNYVLDENGDKQMISSTVEANGLNYLVHYVYNNTDDYDYIDRDAFGVMGHSAGGGNAITTAKEFAGVTYEQSIIKSVYCSGYIKVSAANNYKSLRCNAAMSYAYYDEGSFRYQTASTSFEVIALRFINEVNGGNLGYSELIMDYGYGDISKGTYRVVHNEKINHCFEVYDTMSIVNTIDFFVETLGVDTALSADNQIWWGKEFFNGIALVGAFMMVLSLSGVLITTPFFKSLRGEEVSRIDNQTKSDKLIFWLTLVLTAVIACLDYIPLASLSIQWFPDAAANIFTFFFPARMFNAVLLWAVINGTIGLIIFFGTNLIKNLVEKFSAKKQNRAPVYHFEQFKALRINWKDLLKTLLLSVILFGTFYLAVQISSWLFHQDFRFMMISTGTLNWRFFVTWLMYIPLFFIFYVSNSIRVNCGMTFKNWKEWKIMLVSGLANCIGLVFILIINYVPFITTGSVLYGYYGDPSAEVWLYVNMVFPLIVMMFLLPIFNRIFFKQTNKVYLGAMTNCMIFIMMSLAATVSYIPL